MKRSIMDRLLDMGGELQQRLKEEHLSRLDDAAFEAKISGIEKATLALLEAKVKDEKIVALLQKYWDLRLSEANEFLSCAKDSQD